MKIGLILECQPDGPDEKVLVFLLSKFASEIEVCVECLTNKPGLLNKCGTTAKQLLADGCDRVMIVWDLYPAEWGDALQQKNREPCLHNDREKIHAALNAAEIDNMLVHLVAITYELESWLLADTRAIAAFLSKAVNRDISRREIRARTPDKEPKPKVKLGTIFNQHELSGKGYKRGYKDFVHAEKIAQEIIELAPLKKHCPSFERFWMRATGEQ